MKKILVELVNTCPTCDQYERILEEMVKKYPENITSKVYYAGKDFDYIKKYGPVMKGTIIIDEKKRLDNLSKKTIQEAIEGALGI